MTRKEYDTEIIKSIKESFEDRFLLKVSEDKETTFTMYEIMELLDGEIEFYDIPEMDGSDEISVIKTGVA